MKQLWEFGFFVRSLLSKMKHGELSRAPLRPLRIEWEGNTAECDWMARPADPGDESLPRDMRERQASLQALMDAIAVRDVLFLALPSVRKAVFRAYRESAREPPDLIIMGSVTREEKPTQRVPSVVMRAKLYGFRFSLEDGILEPLNHRGRVLEFMT
jgi:hypothetical protein